MSKAVHLALLLAGVLVVTACSPDASPTAGGTEVTKGTDEVESGSGDAKAFDAMLQEWRETLASHTLPAGFTATEPEDPGEEKLPNGLYGAMVYEAGVGSSMAEFTWFCAWEREWLAQRDVDPAASAAALDQLRTMEQTETYLTGLDTNGQELIRASIAKADLGDPTMIKNDVDINCS